MPLIKIETHIHADIQTCFDVSRDIDLHQSSMQHSNEKAIAGKTSGLIGLGEWVTWEAKHFCVKQQLTSKVTQYDRPFYFVDDMVSGAFKSFKHEHIFTSEEKNRTLMIDRFNFQSPFGILGKIANILFLKQYMRRLLMTRNLELKNAAEQNLQYSKRIG
ncbi:MAG: SRPBCC family protein [Psychroserpens sp.]|uniref:SRPBCC family protein n=1 Tax=Psychroserpens sp. TaxID=2020870 RepID=UPI003C78954F